MYNLQLCTIVLIIIRIELADAATPATQTLLQTVLLALLCVLVCEATIYAGHGGGGDIWWLS
jgi:hypothetical protein